MTPLPADRRPAEPPAPWDHASSLASPAHLQDLADKARDYAKASSSDNTRRAYAADWRHFTAWARRQNLPALPPDPQVLGLYVAACASGTASAGKPKNSVRTIERRLSALMWNFAQRR